MSFEPPGSVVLDSSIVIKWFRRYEMLQEQALQLRQAYLDGHLFIRVPNLLIYEIANVLRYKPDVNETKAQQAIQSLFDMKIRIEHIGPEAIGRAIEMAYSYNVTVYDGVFVALAEQLQAGFITVDEELLQKFHNIPYVYHLADFARQA
jgi:predicted nucleic acid-binding protein